MLVRTIINELSDSLKCFKGSLLTPNMALVLYELISQLESAKVTPCDLENLINKENNQKLQNPALTDTEAIELASLVEDLQDEIIVDYFKYKGALTKLKKCREQLLLHNKNYSDANL